jgi:uncharacterized protein (TIGR03032 family)
MTNAAQDSDTTHVRIVLAAAPRSGAGLLQVLWLADPRWSPEASANSGSSDHPMTVEWAPRNALRLGDLVKEDPHVRIVHVVRDPRMAIPSLVHAWRTGRFVSEPELDGWWGEPWSFPLITGWQELAGRPLHEVAAAQWLGIEGMIHDALGEHPNVPSALVTYEALIDDPEREIKRIAGELDVPWDGHLPEELPLSPLTVSVPNSSKWQRDISETLEAFSARGAQHAEFLTWADTAGLSAYREPVIIERANPLAQQTSRSSDGTPFKSQHTSTLAELLEKSESSLVITTYKSGNVILARSRDLVVDTSVLSFDRPMGVAVAGSRLAIGTGQTIATFTNQPALSEDHDAVFVPRSIISTGDIAIHEMGYDNAGVLWFVNTKFSCLCTQDLDHSFAVAWMPPWITNLTAEDRCHLNGLAMVDGQPRFITALARTDTSNGWREHKGTSGVIYDLAADTIIAEGLSMPHSPRWYDGKLWVLQSGVGSLSTVDPATGEVREIARVPGFSRGLAFIGQYALIGLSQVRESVFTGLPITETTTKRNCGVWVVDTTTGAIVGFLRFEGAVQEIFDVAVLPGVRWPAILDHPEITANAFVLSQHDLQRINSQPSRP